MALIAATRQPVVLIPLLCKLSAYCQCCSDNLEKHANVCPASQCLYKPAHKILCFLKFFSRATGCNCEVGTVTGLNLNRNNLASSLSAMLNSLGPLQCSLKVRMGSCKRHVNIFNVHYMLLLLSHAHMSMCTHAGFGITSSFFSIFPHDQSIFGRWNRLTGKTIMVTMLGAG
jgi:hypothetical protein